jgi:hypothetical protein
MCDASICAAMSKGPPQIAIDALNELRSALTNHSPRGSDRGSSDSFKEEDSRDDKTITKTARTRAQPRRQLGLTAQRSPELVQALADLLLQALGGGVDEEAQAIGGRDECEGHA